MSHYQRLLLIMRPMLHQAVALEQAVALARSASASLHIVALLESLDKLWLLESGKHQAEREAYRLLSMNSWKPRQTHCVPPACR